MVLGLWRHSFVIGQSLGFCSFVYKSDTTWIVWAESLYSRTYSGTHSETHWGTHSGTHPVTTQEPTEERHSMSAWVLSHQGTHPWTHSWTHPWTRSDYGGRGWFCEISNLFHLQRTIPQMTQVARFVASLRTQHTQTFRTNVLQSSEHQTSVSHPALHVHVYSSRFATFHLNISFIPKKTQATWSKSITNSSTNSPMHSPMNPAINSSINSTKNSLIHEPTIPFSLPPHPLQSASLKLQIPLPFNSTQSLTLPRKAFYNRLSFAD